MRQTATVDSEAGTEITYRIVQLGSSGIAMLLFIDGIVFLLEVPVIDQGHHAATACRQ